MSSRTRHVSVWLALAGLVVWGAVSAWSLADARTQLIGAEASLPQAQRALAEGDLASATDAIRDAAERLEAARGRLVSPAIAPLRVLPVVGSDLRTVTVVAETGAEVTAAGLQTIEALDALPGGLRSLAPADGALPVDAIATLARPLQHTAQASAAGIDRLRDTPPASRVARVSSARDRMLEILERTAPQARTGALLAEHLPAFLGAGEARTYLLAATTPAEARNTGGFVGSVAPVRLDHGAPEFGTFIAASDLPELPADQLAPPTDDPVWSRYGGTGSWRNLNRTPDLPTAATAYQRLWAEVGEVEIDGLIFVDPFALAGLLELAGPVEIPDLDVTLDADTVVEYVTNTAYADFEDEDQRKAVLGAAAAASFQGFLGGAGDPDPARTLRTLSDVVGGGHLQVFAADTDVQQAFARTPLAGALPDTTGDLLSLTTYSGTASKVDFYAERAIEHEVRLMADGSSRNSLRVTFVNRAPRQGPPAYVIGPNAPSLEPGDNLFEASLHLAPDARFTHVPDQDPEAGPSFVESELGRPVHRGWVSLPSGSTTRRDYAWSTADAWQLDGEHLTYELVLAGQTTIRATDVTLAVRVPDGFAVDGLPDGAELEDGRIVWRGEVRGETVRLPIRLGR